MPELQKLYLKPLGHPTTAKGAGKQAGVAPAWVGVKAHPETAGYRHKGYAHLSTALCVAPRSPPVLRRHTGNSEPII